MTIRDNPALAGGESPRGTPDDDDNRDDEHEDENEAAVGETDERTEAPEEFEVDDADRT
jgi:hypothetical protein